MYLTYEEYKEYGGTLDEVTFGNYEFQAQAKIDWYTFNRLQNEESYSESVKRCVFVLIGLINLLNQSMSVGPSEDDGSIASAGIASQSNDGVSISYNVMSAQQATEATEKKIADTVISFLQGVTNKLGQKVLYRGVYPNE